LASLRSESGKRACRDFSNRLGLGRRIDIPVRKGVEKALVQPNSRRQIRKNRGIGDDRFQYARYSSVSRLLAACEQAREAAQLRQIGDNAFS
jgi:hypothetical protein